MGLVTAIVVGAALGGAAPSGSAREGLEVGDFFPVRPFPALDDGAPRSVADYRGRRLLLQVFASW